MSRTIYQWEEGLQQQVSGGDVLLGQLPLGHPPYNQIDMDEIGGLLSIQLKGANFKQSIRYVERKFPLSFALYLVLHGVYSYDSGEFWSKVESHLGNNTKGFQVHYCGEAFRRILTKYNLPTFEHIEGHTNLVPILAHGGIPNASLNRFFYILEKTVFDSLISLDAKSLIEDWSKNSDEKLYFVGRPVRRFVLNGGAVAEDFINRCLILVDSEKPEEVQNLQLPERVINAYWQWRKGAGPKRSTWPKVRLERPFLYLDPYGDGVCIGLPPLFFPTTHKQNTLVWCVEADEFDWTELTYRERVAGGYEYKIQSLVRPSVAPSYDVILLADSKDIRSWQIPGFSPEQPLFIFDPDTYQALNQFERRRPGIKWLMYPREYKLQVTNGQMLRALPQQYSEWGRFLVEEWQLLPGSELNLYSEQEKIYTEKIFNELAVRRPFFQGGHKPLEYHDSDIFPLYSGLPPELVISFPYLPDDNQLARWTITLQSEVNSIPARRITYALPDLREAISMGEENTVSVDLSSDRLLGKHAIGKFEINAQGPFGRGRRLGLRIIPFLSIEGHTKLLLSNSDGPTTLFLTCDEESEIELRSGGSGTDLTSQKSQTKVYKAEFESNIAEARFVFQRKTINIQIPFTVRLRHLRWGLWQPTRPGDLVWEKSPLRIYPQSLDEPHKTELRVELPVFGDYPSLFCGWRLVDAEGVVKKDRPPSLEHSRERFSIPLGEVMPEFREAQQFGEVLRLQLWVHIEDCDVEEKFIDTLFLLPTLDLGEIIADWQEIDSQIKLAIMWEYQRKIQFRQLFLWPIDQPWVEQPIRLSIEDEAIDSEEWQFPISHYEMLHDYRGSYLGEIKIVDPWDSQISVRPTQDDLNVVYISPPDEREYYIELENALNEGNATPDQLLTLLAFEYRMGQNKKMHRTNRELSMSAKQHKLELSKQVLWAEIARDMDDSSVYKLAQLSIFSPTVVMELDPKSNSRSLMERYFAHLPSIDDAQALEDTYVYLASSFESVRKQCIVGLCNCASQYGFILLLEDVASARILVTEAAEILKPVKNLCNKIPNRKENPRCG